jgi:hypothetical protein
MAAITAPNNAKRNLRILTPSAAMAATLMFTGLGSVVADGNVRMAHGQIELGGSVHVANSNVIEWTKSFQASL